jgi:hypothetical protein
MACWSCTANRRVTITPLLTLADSSLGSRTDCDPELAALSTGVTADSVIVRSSPSIDGLPPQPSSVTDDYKEGDNKFTGKIHKLTVELK